MSRQAIADLGIDVVGTDDVLGETSPGVLAFVREPGTTKHRNRSWASIIVGIFECDDQTLECNRPGGSDKFVTSVVGITEAIASDQRCGQALVAHGGFKAETIAVG